jgi:class 3 adenylate cyclase
VRRAVAIQQTTRVRAAGERLAIRAGLHVGEALRDESDWMGTPVVVARRLCDRATAAVKRAGRRTGGRKKSPGVAYRRVCIFRRHVAQFLGDGVMAFFGYPEAHDNGAERAARAGLAILDAIAKAQRAGDASEAVGARRYRFGCGGGGRERQQGRRPIRRRAEHGCARADGYEIDSKNAISGRWVAKRRVNRPLPAQKR